MILNHRHFTEGGTGVTNFDPEKEKQYAAAIAAYDCLYGDRQLAISTYALGGHAGLYSLHAGGRGDLSKFWQVYEALGVVKTQPYCTKLVPQDIFAKKPIPLPNMTAVAKVPDGEKVVGMCVHQDAVIIATDRGVYAYKDGKWLPMHAMTFDDVVRPVMKWLADNCHPHTEITITQSSAEQKEGVQSIVTTEFVRD